MSLGNTGYHVRRMFMVETAAYDPIYLRPYTTNYDTWVKDRIFEATDYGSNINHYSLAPAASSFISPSPHPMGQAAIENGFGEKRLSFMIEIVAHNGGINSSQQRHVLTGYTSHLGVSTLGYGSPSIDPNMRLFLNNYIIIRDVSVQTQYGTQIQSNLVDARHLLNPSVYSNQLNNSSSLWGLRPQDVAAYLQYQTNPLAHESQASIMSNMEAHPTINLLSGITTSNKDWNLSSKYISTSLEKYFSVQADDTSFDGEEDNTMWENMRNRIREDPLTQADIMQDILMRTSYHQEGCVTYQELLNVFPDADAVNEIRLANRQWQAKEYRPGQGEYWAKVGWESSIATILQQSVPSIMTSCLFTQVRFHATNNTFDGVDRVTPMSFNLFTEGLSEQTLMMNFIDRLRREVLHDVSKGGNWSYEITVDLNMLYDSHFWISINSQPAVYFAAPTFCDALYSPVISTDPNQASALSNDVSALFGALSSQGSMPMSTMQQAGQPQQPIMPQSHGGFANQQPPTFNQPQIV